MRHVVLDDAQRERLALWVLDLLDADEAGALAAHVAGGCAACAAEAAALRAVTDELAYAPVPQAPPPALRDRLRAAVQGDRRDFRFARADDGGWRLVAPGIAVRVLAEDAASASRSHLIRMDAGARLGRHVHAGAEHCLVIEGDVEVAGRMLAPGDFHLAAPGSAHEGITTRGGCLLLIVESAAIA